MGNNEHVNNALDFLHKEAKVTADGDKKPIVIQQINVQPVHRKSQDIQNWRNALSAAEGHVPQRTALYDLYEDILLDAHLSTVIEKRIIAITNAEWEFVDASGKVVDDVQEWVESMHFETVITEIINSKIWGYSMIEFDFRPEDGPAVFLVPRKHMRPEEGGISKEQYGTSQMSVREGRYRWTVVEVGKEKDLGLLLKACPYVIYKRGGFADWAQFAEVFGQPIVDATWDGFDEGVRIKLQEALDNMGGGTKLVRPAGTELTLHQGASNNPTGDLYNNIIKASNAELSKLFLGQTETTESSESSGYAQSETHSKTENGINKADRLMVERVLNTRVKRILEINGWSVDGGSFKLKEKDEQVSKKDKFDMVIRARNEGKLPISDEWMYDEFSIEKPDNYDELKVEMEEQSSISDYNFSAPEAEPIWRRFWPFSAAPVGGAHINIRLSEFYGKPCCEPIELASQKPKINEAFVRAVFEKKFGKGQVDTTYYLKVAKILEEAILSKISNVDFDPKRQAYLGHLKHNVFAFSMAKSLTHMKAMADELTDENGEARSYGSFRQKVTQIDQEFNDNHLRTERNSALRIAEMTDKHEYLQKFEWWEYRTVGDDRVRDKHKKLHGKVFHRDDPIWDKIYPPNDWGCRCTVIPSTKKTPSDYSEIKDSASKGAIKPYFRRNFAKSDSIFPSEHPYFREMQAMGLKAQNLTATRNYGMPTVDQIFNRGDLPFIDKSITREDSISKFAEYGMKPIEARDGLSVVLDRAFFKKIVNLGRDKYQDRHHYAHLAPNVLKQADEVWSQERSGRLQTVYIKYMADGPYIFITHENEGKHVFKTFYKADRRQQAELRRKGILKYRK